MFCELEHNLIDFESSLLIVKKGHDALKGFIAVFFMLENSFQELNAVSNCTEWKLDYLSLLV